MPESTLTRLGNCMRAARKARGLTQDGLAEQSGVSTRHIAKIEKGVMNPSFEKLSPLVTTLGMSFDALFFPSTEREAADIKELTGLYKACPEQGQRLISATVRALANELMDAEQQKPQSKE